MPELLDEEVAGSESRIPSGLFDDVPEVKSNVPKNLFADVPARAGSAKAEDATALELPKFEPPPGYKGYSTEHLTPEEMKADDWYVESQRHPFTTPFAKIIPRVAPETVERIMTFPAAIARHIWEETPDEPDPEGGMRAKKQPAIIEKMAEAIPSKKLVAITTGVEWAAADLGNFFTSPLGIATLGIGALPKAAQHVIALGFAGQMAKDVPEIARQLGDEWGKPEEHRDYQKISQLVATGVSQTGFSVAGALHGVGKPIVESTGATPLLRAAEAARPVAPMTAAVITGQALEGIKPRGAVEPLKEATPGLELNPPNERAERMKQMTVAATGDPLLSKRSAEVPEVPQTPPEPERNLTVGQEIRAKNAQTIGDIQRLFPESNLSREDARKLRNQAWGATAPPAQPKPVEGASEVPAQGSRPNEVVGEDWKKTNDPANAELLQNLPPVKPGFVRMFHGGDDPRGGDARDITPYFDYAKGYAAKSGSQVWYVDVPESAPYMRKAFEEFEGGPKSPWINTRAPGDEMKGAKFVTEVPSKYSEPSAEQPTSQATQSTLLERPQSDWSYDTLKSLSQAERGKIASDLRRFTKDPRLSDKEGLLVAGPKAIADVAKDVIERRRQETERREASDVEPQQTSTVFDTATVPIVDLPVESISISEDVPNFKRGADPETGVVKGEQLHGKLETLGLGPIVVWKRKSGALEVITGRHRLDLARRNQDETIRAQVVEEDKGFTQDMALTVDAESNIRDGQGSVEDFAYYFRNSPQITEEAAGQRGLLARAKGKAGWDLGRNASDDLYAAYQGGKISEAQALAAVRAAPGNEAAQRIGLKFASQGKDPDFISNVIKAALSESKGRGETLDLFGADDSAMQQMAEQAARASAIQRGLREQIQSAAGAAKRPEVAKTLGVDVNDPEAVRAKISELKSELARWDNWPLQPDLVAKVRGESSVGSATPDLTLAPAETVEEQRARLEQVATAEKAKAEKEKLAQSAARPLAGTAGDLGQGDLLEQPEDLFAPQTPKVSESEMPGAPPMAKAAASQTELALPEDRPLGIVAPSHPVISAIAEAFLDPRNALTGAGHEMSMFLKGFAGESMPRTTEANRELGELGVRYASSKVAARPLADLFTAQSLEGMNVDPVKFGAALTEDNLRSVRESFTRQAEALRRRGNHDAADAAEESAAQVVSLIGARSFPFRNEGEYQQFLSEPATRQAIAQHIQQWQDVIEPQFKAAQQIDPEVELPTRGLQTGARVNLKVVFDEPAVKPVTGVGGPNPTATFRKKSPFGITAKGTGETYEIAYPEIVANTFERQLEIANKNLFDKRLVETGNAVIAPPGRQITIAGEQGVPFPLQRRLIITNARGGRRTYNQNENIYIRKSLAGEYRSAANLDPRFRIPIATKTMELLNRTALAGLTDFTVHTSNLATALFNRPTSGKLLTDTLLSATGRADIPITLTKAILKSFRDNKAQVAELAQIGAMRAGEPGITSTGKILKFIDRTTRLVLDDTFKRLAESDVFENTETARREYVNQVGQYNRRLQGSLTVFLRDSGFGPFVTAGKTFNAMGVRMVTLSPGAKATSPMAAIALRANALSKWVGAAVLIGTLNYLLTKDKGGGVMGRPGTPIGKLDTGLDDHAGRPLQLPLFDIVGLGRGLRVTGIKGFVDSKRLGLSTGTALDTAARDIFNSAVAPAAGPPVRFAAITAIGYPPAVNVGRVAPVAKPGSSQFRENFLEALKEANPVVASYFDVRAGNSVSEALSRQLPRFTLSPGKSPETVENYPKIVGIAQANAYAEFVARKWHTLPEDQRDNFITQALQGMDEDQRRMVETALHRRKIRWSSE